MMRGRADGSKKPRLREESGTTLVLVAALMVVLLGMAGFAVDLGWLFLQQSNARKAAESAALAGVVNMPPTGPWGVGEEAYDTAIDVAGRSGYTSGVTPLLVAGEDHQLEVQVTTTTDTFFMRLFGIDTVTITENAIAEALPPLRLGSDQPLLGNDPTTGSWSGFWLAVNGDSMAKGQGDPYTTKCLGPDSNNSCPAGPGSPSLNPDFRRPSYYIAFDVPASEVGKSLSFEIYDPQMARRGNADDRDDDNRANLARNSTSNVMNTQFTVYKPDATPADPTDNSTVVCSRTWVAQGSSGYNWRWRDQWRAVCSATAQRGIYVMAISVTGWSGNLNGFSVRARVNGSSNNNVAVYGMQAMSIWNTGGGWQPGGTVANFKLVDIVPTYAGEQVIIGLWDVGDLNSAGSLDFRGSVSGYECSYRVINDNGSIARNWGPDDGDSAGAQCRINISIQEFNNQWLQIRFDIPDSHSCSGSACWATVNYNFAGGAHDRTTWTATVNGQPVHLLPSG